MKKTIAFIGIMALIIVSFIAYLVFNKPEEKKESFEEISVNDVEYSSFNFSKLLYWQ